MSDLNVMSFVTYVFLAGNGCFVWVCRNIPYQSLCASVIYVLHSLGLVGQSIISLTKILEMFCVGVPQQSISLTMCFCDICFTFLGLVAQSIVSLTKIFVLYV